MNVTWHMLITVCPMVFLASVVDSIGGGGGLISLPAYLLAGLPAQTASGTNKFSACFGTLLAAIRYHKSGKILYKPALLAVLGAFPGSYVGAWIQQQLSETFVRGFMLAALPLIAVLFFIKRDYVTQTRPIERRQLIECFLIGLGCGLYDGFFGPGAGTLLTMLFAWIVKMDMISASGCAKVVNFSTNAAALVSFFMGGHVLLPLATIAAVCSVAGGYLGASLALKKGACLIRYVMLGVLALLIGKLAWEFIHTLR